MGRFDIDRLLEEITAEAETSSEKAWWGAGTFLVDVGPTAEELVVRLETRAPVDLVAFYRRCRSVQLPDVGNGIFVHPLEDVVDGNRGQPHRVTGRISDDVVAFGSDGGGARFAQRLQAPNEILYLPPGVIENGVYLSDDSLFRPLAEGIVGFLAWVLERSRHPEEGW